MSEAEITDQRSQSSNGSHTSTQRVARLRERRRRGVLHIASVEVFARDLQVLKRCGVLTTDDPSGSAKTMSKMLSGACWTAWRGDWAFLGRSRSRRQRATSDQIDILGENLHAMKASLQALPSPARPTRCRGNGNRKTRCVKRASSVQAAARELPVTCPSKMNSTIWSKWAKTAVHRLTHSGVLLDAGNDRNRAVTSAPA